METFSALLVLCEGNSPDTDEFPWQKPVKRSFDVFSDLRLNKQLSKQSRRQWFETPPRPLWSHCNAFGVKPLPVPLVIYCNLDPYEQCLTTFEWKYEAPLQYHGAAGAGLPCQISQSRGGWFVLKSTAHGSKCPINMIKLCLPIDVGRKFS